MHLTLQVLTATEASALPCEQRHLLRLAWRLTNQVQLPALPTHTHGGS
jgi:hypothetical protein